MSSTPYNLDDGYSEYFPFIVKGHLYHFRYPTTAELKKWDESRDSESMKNFLSEFITPGDDKAPPFIEIVDQLTVRHWKMFGDMMSEEMSLNGQSKRTETT